MGQFFAENFVGLGADNCLYRIFESLERVIDLREIVMDHVNHNAIEKIWGAADATAREMREKSWANPVDPRTFDISREVDLLKNYIEKRK
jgi:hypothetical protein